ncbi:MAG: taurine catabolism dioxygenase TauD [Gammaproteobacteria bacterium]|nr:MAG: taurine catabolism dioxygenase TauD [Gammaproteobacteria bacterium]RTZ76696.1 MAG: taurine catabolism dioxygenase TauD [Gammaproteobacteria bacterium]
MSNPFDLDDNEAYQRWREQKLEDYPTSLEQLVVEIDDPRQLTPAEHEALAQRIAKTNMAIYASGTGEDPDKEIVRRLGLQFGLERLDHNMCADDDAISSLEQADTEPRTGYIPYTNRPIAWHTDGYYNDLDRQILGLLLHCVRPAAEGGMNQLLDHEIAYIQLRDENPDYIRAFEHPEAMSIPPNVVDGEELRGWSSGPVFMTLDDGSLHMRYTHRKRNIRWRDDETTREAVAFLGSIMNADNPYYFEGTLDSGQGLICNNVLHTRTGFEENSRRLLYRGRYFDRIRLED